VPALETAVRPGYRPYPVSVRRAVRLTPYLTRVTFTGDELVHFGTAGLDQRIKIVLPLADGSFSDLGQHDGAGDWYDRWRALPDAARNPFRTYTVRRVAPQLRELDVDFVVHHDAGPAGAWAEAAAEGDRVLVVGPDERSPHSRIGIDWHPGSARRVLLVGDETAAPAITSILETLDPGIVADAFIEVPTPDAVPLARDVPGHRLAWLDRGARSHGTRLVEAVADWAADSAELLRRAAAPRRQELEDVDVDSELLWDVPEGPEGEFYAWIAGEAATVKALRRMLVTGHGVDRSRVAFMGYWRLGRAERV
jgi:NADPH-dependent ferric siderophore reductase